MPATICASVESLPARPAIADASAHDAATIVQLGSGSPRLAPRRRQGGGDEVAEQRVGLGRLRLELGVELHGQEPGVVGQLDDLDERRRRGWCR